MNVIYIMGSSEMKKRSKENEPKTPPPPPSSPAPVVTSQVCKVICLMCLFVCHALLIKMFMCL